MIMLKRFLFPTNPNGVFISVILLVVRIVFGILMMNHGIDKWANYQELSTVFPDPLGIGSPFLWDWPSLANWHAQWSFIIGFLYRLAMIPMIFTMCVAFFIVHGNDPFAVKRTCICLFGGICIDVYYRTGKICRRPLDFPISFSQIEINKALLFYRILFFAAFLMSML